MGTIITVAMTKGGVGKTATAVNLATAMAGDGYRVCLVDLDQQGNATYSVTGLAKYQFNDRGLFDLLMEDGRSSTATDAFLHETKVKNLSLLPATGMSNQILPLLSILKARHPEKKEYMIPEICLSSLRDHFDFIILDTPPAKDSLTLSGIFAADLVLLPINADKYSLDALMETYSLIRSIRQEDGKNVDILGIVLTKTERNSATTLVRKKLHAESFAPFMLNTEIRKGAAIIDSTLLGGPVLITDPRSNPAKDYICLYQEIMETMRKREE